uniref:Phosphoglycerate mutase n=1 Tax=Neobodo designis TaxID=312471 RepID=A0A7S1QZS4_NEODS|mmetsp:Transcript_5734/g.18007  ORF Transcript_5734/g.18007 Transcript_5734/m.18007 type:complete len:186 (+) Transcript_5734:48-605(+)
MKRLFLCRHGQDEDNANKLLNGHRDTPLTELGRSQAEAVAAKVAKEHGQDIDVIVCSPLQRAHNTAKAIGGAVGKEPTVMPELVERDFGALSGQPLADIPKLATKTMELSQVCYFLDGEGVETFDACHERAAKVLAHLNEAYAGRGVLVVSHGDFGKMLLAHRRGISWQDALATPFIGNTDLLEL